MNTTYLTQKVVSTAAFAVVAAALIVAAPVSIDRDGIVAKAAFAKNGADNGAGDDHGGRGRGGDDGAGHDSGHGGGHK